MTNFETWCLTRPAAMSVFVQSMYESYRTNKQFEVWRSEAGVPESTFLKAESGLLRHAFNRAKELGGYWSSAAGCQEWSENGPTAPRQICTPPFFVSLVDSLRAGLTVPFSQVSLRSQEIYIGWIIDGELAARICVRWGAPPCVELSSKELVKSSASATWLQQDIRRVCERAAALDFRMDLDHAPGFTTTKLVKEGDVLEISSRFHFFGEETRSDSEGRQWSQLKIDLSKREESNEKLRQIKCPLARKAAYLRTAAYGIGDPTEIDAKANDFYGPGNHIPMSLSMWGSPVDTRRGFPSTQVARDYSRCLVDSIRRRPGNFSFLQNTMSLEKEELSFWIKDEAYYVEVLVRARADKPHLPEARINRAISRTGKDGIVPSEAVTQIVASARSTYPHLVEMGVLKEVFMRRKGTFVTEPGGCRWYVVQDHEDRNTKEVSADSTEKKQLEVLEHLRAKLLEKHPTAVLMSWIGGYTLSFWQPGDDFSRSLEVGFIGKELQISERSALPQDDFVRPGTFLQLGAQEPGGHVPVRYGIASPESLIKGFDATSESCSEYILTLAILGKIFDRVDPNTFSCTLEGQPFSFKYAEIMSGRIYITLKGPEEWCRIRCTDLKIPDSPDVLLRPWTYDLGPNIRGDITFCKDEQDSNLANRLEPGTVVSPLSAIQQVLKDRLKNIAAKEYPAYTFFVKDEDQKAWSLKPGPCPEGYRVADPDPPLGIREKKVLEELSRDGRYHFMFRATPDASFFQRAYVANFNEKRIGPLESVKLAREGSSIKVCSAGTKGDISKSRTIYSSWGGCQFFMIVAAGVDTSAELSSFYDADADANRTFLILKTIFGADKVNPETLEIQEEGVQFQRAIPFSHFTNLCFKVQEKSVLLRVKHGYAAKSLHIDPEVDFLRDWMERSEGLYPDQIEKDPYLSMKRTTPESFVQFLKSLRTKEVSPPRWVVRNPDAFRRRVLWFEYEVPVDWEVLGPAGDEDTLVMEAAKRICDSKGGRIQSLFWDGPKLNVTYVVDGQVHTYSSEMNLFDAKTMLPKEDLTDKIALLQWGTLPHTSGNVRGISLPKNVSELTSGEFFNMTFDLQTYLKNLFSDVDPSTLSVKVDTLILPFVGAWKGFQWHVAFSLPNNRHLVLIGDQSLAICEGLPDSEALHLGNTPTIEVTPQSIREALSRDIADSFKGKWVRHRGWDRRMWWISDEPPPQGTEVLDPPKPFHPETPFHPEFASRVQNFWKSKADKEGSKVVGYADHEGETTLFVQDSDGASRIVNCLTIRIGSENQMIFSHEMIDTFKQRTKVMPARSSQGLRGMAGPKTAHMSPSNHPLGYEHVLNMLRNLGEVDPETLTVTYRTPTRSEQLLFHFAWEVGLTKKHYRVFLEPEGTGKLLRINARLSEIRDFDITDCSEEQDYAGSGSWSPVERDEIHARIRATLDDLFARRDLASQPMSALRQHLSAASIRVAARQMLRLVADPLAGAVGSSDSTARILVSDLLRSDAGKAVLAPFLSLLLQQIADSGRAEKSAEVLRELSKELRIYTLTEIGDALAEVVTQPLREAVASAFQSKPEPQVLLKQLPEPSVSASEILETTATVETVE